MTLHAHVWGCLSDMQCLAYGMNCKRVKSVTITNFLTSYFRSIRSERERHKMMRNTTETNDGTSSLATQRLTECLWSALARSDWRLSGFTKWRIVGNLRRSFNICKALLPYVGGARTVGEACARRCPAS